MAGIGTYGRGGGAATGGGFIPSSTAGRLPPASGTAAPVGQSEVSSALKSILGQTQQTTQAPTTPTPAPEPTTNTAAPNPVSNGVIDQLISRANGPGNIAAELDRGIQGVRDRADLGIAGANQVTRVARGTSGSGMDQFDADRLKDSQRADINSMTTDLVLGRQRDVDGLLTTAGNMGLSQGAQQQASQQIANQQTAQAQNAQLQREANMIAAQTNSFNTLLNFLNA